jgi:hypothetical protein
VSGFLFNVMTCTGLRDYGLPDWLLCLCRYMQIGSGLHSRQMDSACKSREAKSDISDHKWLQGIQIKEIEMLPAQVIREPCTVL